MKARRLFRALVGWGVAAASLVACATAGDDQGQGTPKDDPAADVAQATAALPEAEVLQATPDGVPTFITGELAKVGPGQMDDRASAEAALRPALGPALAPFRLTADNVRLRKLNVDENGNRHFRYQQTFNGLDVVGGDLVVHVDIKGSIFAINGTARGDIPATLGKSDIGETQALARVAGDARFAGMIAGAPARLVYLINDDGAMYKAYEIEVTGLRGLDPARDKVYVSVDSGAIVAVHPQIYFAKSRKVYSANNRTTLPGTLIRSEGSSTSSDVDINAAYDNTGATYDAYKNFWNRDSYDNAGAVLVSSVHYSTSYCNAFWNSTQMVYGDGSGSDCLPLARAVDVTAHELTHAVTENESNLNYSGESGGLNEAMSDIFGAFTEAFVDGGSNGTLAVSADTWKVGEDILPPALRYMNDPAADGYSLDYWTSSSGSYDVHYSSGIANLAFYLMSQGGTHPRGKSSVVVTGIGITKAIKVFYYINTNVLTSSSNFLAARNASLTAATSLGFSQAEKDSVQNAWAAVGVGAAAGGGTPPPPDPGSVVLTNGVAVTGISGAAASSKYYTLTVPSGASNLKFVLSGGTGDADMYVKFGAQPTQTSYDCRPYLYGNNETCSITTAQEGTYYVMLYGYSSYASTSLTGSYTTGSTPPPPGGPVVLVNGVPVTGVAGAVGTNTYFQIAVPKNKPVVTAISGGTGDADLYTKWGSLPTTSSYNCRPYLTGNNESCTNKTSLDNRTLYIMIRGYTAYTGVTIKSAY